MYYRKFQLPVLTYLRNPALKPRHWVKIEEILHTRFSPDQPVTLHVFEELHAFQHADELMEVAGQASSEAGLEALLKKVGLNIFRAPHQKATNGITYY